MIHELLSVGADHAITGRKLAECLDCEIRDITVQIERERRAGYPICANMGGLNAGYYLAADAEELEDYCNRLQGRETELCKTRLALVSILKKIRSK